MCIFLMLLGACSCRSNPASLSFPFLTFFTPHAHPQYVSPSLPCSSMQHNGLLVTLSPFSLVHFCHLPCQSYRHSFNIVDIT